MTTERNNAVTIAWIGAIGVILAAVAAMFGQTISAYLTKGSSKGTGVTPIVIPLQVVPPVEAKTVATLHEETPSSEIETLRDVSMWDLRAWRPVLPGTSDNRYSAVNYVNYLHVRKLKPVDVYRAHYSTDGAMIDLRCITHRAEILQQAGEGQHPGEDKHTYEVVVDVKDVAVGNEFLIVVEGTFWNDFQNLKQEEASTYTDEDIHQMNELAMFIMMPEQKPFTNTKRWERPSKSPDSSKVAYDGNERFYTDQNGRFVYWSIQNRKPNTHYQLTWDW